ncbi:MAG: hypothetical protein Q4F82_04790 [bacterium]|nr:hypothetical protein [bacterium]
MVWEKTPWSCFISNYRICFDEYRNLFENPNEQMRNANPVLADLQSASREYQHL